jgi:hypothetical protein
LRVDAGFASIARIRLACFNIEEAEENAWSLAEKQMWHRHNSLLASL